MELLLGSNVSSICFDVAQNKEKSNWTDTYEALCDVMEIYEEPVLELAGVCQSFALGDSGEQDQTEILAAGEFIGFKLMETCEKLLAEIMVNRRIVFLLLLPAL
jgi:hypothetical protein